MVHVVAQRGDGIYLLAEQDEDAFEGEGWIYNQEQASVSRKMPLGSFMKFGYWEAVSDDVDTQDIEVEAEALLLQQTRDKLNKALKKDVETDPW
jgi:hypothetical protein